jgi:hypothetical protein
MYNSTVKTKMVQSVLRKTRLSSAFVPHVLARLGHEGEYVGYKLESVWALLEKLLFLSHLIFYNHMFIYCQNIV